MNQKNYICYFVLLFSTHVVFTAEQKDQSDFESVSTWIPMEIITPHSTHSSPSFITSSQLEAQDAYFIEDLNISPTEYEEFLKFFTVELKQSSSKIKIEKTNRSCSLSYFLTLLNCHR